MTRTGLVVLTLAIICGAFGVHGLGSMVTENRLETWETAVRYQAWMSLSMIGLGVSSFKVSSWAFWFVCSGLLIFSGSLYALVLLDLGILGVVAPIGGALMIAGLLLSAISLKPCD
tara:strand:- start:2768 stop:3115 length:348 start_codon:yes stop_codon:yes gene_type:complete